MQPGPWCSLTPRCPGSPRGQGTSGHAPALAQRVPSRAPRTPWWGWGPGGRQDAGLLPRGKRRLGQEMGTPGSCSWGRGGFSPRFLPPSWRGESGAGGGGGTGAGLGEPRSPQQHPRAPTRDGAASPHPSGADASPGDLHPPLALQPGAGCKPSPAYRSPGKGHGWGRMGRAGPWRRSIRSCLPPEQTAEPLPAQGIGTEPPRSPVLPRVGAQAGTHGWNRSEPPPTPAAPGQPRAPLGPARRAGARSSARPAGWGMPRVGGLRGQGAPALGAEGWQDSPPGGRAAAPGAASAGAAGAAQPGAGPVQPSEGRRGPSLRHRAPRRRGN